MIPVKLNLFEIETEGSDKTKYEYIYLLKDNTIYKLLVNINRTKLLDIIYELKEQAETFDIITLKELYSNKYYYGPNTVVSNEGKYRLKNKIKKTNNFKVPSLSNNLFYEFCSLYKKIEFTNDTTLDQGTLDNLYLKVGNKDIYNKFLQSLDIFAVKKINFDKIATSLENVKRYSSKIDVHYDLRDLENVISLAVHNQKVLKECNLEFNDNKQKIKHK